MAKKPRTAGKIVLVVSDKSDFHNFHLTGPGVNVKTAVPAIGSKTFGVTLKGHVPVRLRPARERDEEAHSGCRRPSSPGRVRGPAAVGSAARRCGIAWNVVAGDPPGGELRRGATSKARHRTARAHRPAGLDTIGAETGAGLGARRGEWTTACSTSWSPSRPRRPGSNRLEEVRRRRRSSAAT